MSKFSLDHISQTDYRKDRESQDSSFALQKINTDLSEYTIPTDTKLLLRERIIKENEEFLATLLPGSIRQSMERHYLDTILKDLGL
jgi:hypothetical protein